MFRGSHVYCKLYDLFACAYDPFIFLCMCLRDKKKERNRARKKLTERTKKNKKKIRKEREYVREKEGLCI